MPPPNKKALDARGLRYGGSHVLLPNLRDVRPLIDYLHAVDSRDICNSGLMTWGNLSADDYRQAVLLLNEAGRAFRQESIHLHYHHHDFEFQAVEGATTGMDILLEGLDPEAVDLCVDIAWVQKGGSDPAEYLRRHKGPHRLPALQGFRRGRMDGVRSGGSRHRRRDAGPAGDAQRPLGHSGAGHDPRGPARKHRRQPPLPAGDVRVLEPSRRCAPPSPKRRGEEWLSPTLSETPSPPVSGGEASLSERGGFYHPRACASSPSAAKAGLSCPAPA